MSQAIRAAIESASTYLTEHPDEAAYTDSLASATLGEGLRVAVRTPTGGTLETDMTTGIGGRGEHPSPGWLLRAAAASCVATLAAMRAAQLGVEGLTCEVDVDSRSDDRGILGLADDIPAGPLSMRVAVRLAAPGADEGTLRAIGEWAVTHCPVCDAIGRAVPVAKEITPG